MKRETHSLGTCFAEEFRFKNSNMYKFCFPDCKQKYILIAEKNHWVLLQFVFVRCFSVRRLQHNRAEMWVVVNLWAHAPGWNRHDQAGLAAC